MPVATPHAAPACKAADTMSLFPQQMRSRGLRGKHKGARPKRLSRPGAWCEAREQLKATSSAQRHVEGCNALQLDGFRAGLEKAPKSRKGSRARGITGQGEKRRLPTSPRDTSAQPTTYRSIGVPKDMRGRGLRGKHEGARPKRQSRPGAWCGAREQLKATSSAQRHGEGCNALQLDGVWAGLEKAPKSR